MVPRALWAHFNYVTRQFSCPLFQTLHVFTRSDAVATWAKIVAEHIRDEHQIGLFTDRAFLVGFVANIAGCSHELWMRVANIQPGKTAVLEVSDDRAARQGVIDLALVAFVSRGPSNHPWLQAHCLQAYLDVASIAPRVW